MHDSTPAAQRGTPRWALLAFEREKLACVVPLRAQPVRAGRGDHCDLRLSDHSVSREHCRFEIVEGDVVLVDLHSRNGTVRFGQRLLRSRLREGDEIALGNALVKLVDLGRPGWSIDGDLFGDLYLDAETGLLNWRGFLSRTESLLAAADAEGGTALACLRLLAPAAGAMRQAFGRALREACEGDSIVAHQGGGEFACLFPAGGGAAAKRCLDRLRASAGAEASLRFAAGVAVVAGAASFPSLWCAAQDELYLACADPGGVSIKHVADDPAQAPPARAAR